MGAVCCAIVDLPKAGMEGGGGGPSPPPVQGFWLLDGHVLLEQGADGVALLVALLPIDRDIGIHQFLSGLAVVGFGGIVGNYAVHPALDDVALALVGQEPVGDGFAGGDVVVGALLGRNGHDRGGSSDQVRSKNR